MIQAIETSSFGSYNTSKTSKNTSSSSFADVLAASGTIVELPKKKAVAASTVEIIKTQLHESIEELSRVPEQDKSFIAEYKSYAPKFEQLVNKAFENGGYDDPLAFINSLSTEELDTLQHISQLADPINPSTLTKEGALNLIYAPGHGKDLNQDGFYEAGIGRTTMFPPDHAPDSVKQAWKDATKNMNWMEKATLEFHCTIVEAASNNNGMVNGQLTNVYIAPDTDYSQFTKDTISHLLASKADKNAKQKEWVDRDIAVLQDFLTKLLS